MSVEIVFNDKEARKMIDGLIKNVGRISDRAREYVGILSTVVIRDIVDHFANEEGENGRWAPWSRRYTKYMLSVGKGGNLILSDTGRLRQGWQPARYRASKDGVLWYNPVEYAAKHDEGINPYPKRKFAWLSKHATEDLAIQTLKFIDAGTK